MDSTQTKTGTRLNSSDTVSGLKKGLLTHAVEYAIAGIIFLALCRLAFGGYKLAIAGLIFILAVRLYFKYKKRSGNEVMEKSASVINPIGLIDAANDAAYVVDDVDTDDGLVHHIETPTETYKIKLVTQSDGTSRVCSWKKSTKLKLERSPSGFSRLRTDGIEWKQHKKWESSSMPFVAAQLQKSKQETVQMAIKAKVPQDVSPPSNIAANDSVFKPSGGKQRELPVFQGEVTALGVRTHLNPKTGENYDMFCVEVTDSTGQSHTAKGASVRDEVEQVKVKVGDSVRIEDKGWTQVSIPQRDGPAKTGNKHQYKIFKV